MATTAIDPKNMLEEIRTMGKEQVLKALHKGILICYDGEACMNAHDDKVCYDGNGKVIVIPRTSDSILPVLNTIADWLTHEGVELQTNNVIYQQNPTLLWVLLQAITDSRSPISVELPSHLGFFSMSDYFCSAEEDLEQLKSAVFSALQRT